DISDGMDKSWDHPWTTEEMRKKRREWSLAGDAGLLKHLQQFSENLASKADKTQEALDSLTTQLNETAIFVDNVTNTSLALANNQFIESRVQEDDVDIEKNKETSVEKLKDEDSEAADLIASVSESIKQGLNIMYEKYKEMEFVDSDSEEEDNKVVLSVVLGPNNPYQDRPLPYTIGSEKWKTSNKIGLESSSSSESEQVDEEEESESEDDSIAAFKDFSMEAAPKTNIESDYSKRNDITYMGNEKIDVVSQNNIGSVPESITSNDNVSKVPLPNNVASNFAEELAKRLGTVGQPQKPSVADEKNESTINQFKDDLFTPEEDENALSDKTNKIFNENKGFLSNQPAENVWKEKQIKSYKNNIIPASIDVPPPISTVSTKPKSSIDDLFADADSEDSDGFFSSKNTVKTITKKKYSNNNNHSFNAEDAQKKYLDTITPAGNIATSTPETNLNSANLFSDDEDVGDLFGSSKTESPNKKVRSQEKPEGGVSKLGNILTSDFENKLSNILQSHSELFGSSGNNTSGNYKSGVSSEPVHDHSRYTISNDNINERGSIETARNTLESLDIANETSGISIHPPSINNTGGSSIGVDFQPQMTSSRLKSEEIYRERVASDSLFTARSRNAANATSNSASNSTNSQLQEESIGNFSGIRQDDVFENEDLFGPPPLPKADSKPTKSKVSSLFDDSDSGDEFISTTSSSSSRDLFDEVIDIFGNKDIFENKDIFGIIPKLTAKEESNIPGRKFSDIPDDDMFASNIRDTVTKSNVPEKSQNVVVPKRISLFDDDDDNDLFAAKPVKTETKSESRIFSDDEENDLFTANKPIGGKQRNDKQSVETTSGIDIVDQKVSDGKREKKDSRILADNELFSTTTGSRGFVFEDDDYDGLFGGTKTVTTKKTKEITEVTTVKESSVKDTEILDDSNMFAKPKEPNVSASTSNKLVEEITGISMHKDSSEKRETTENVKHEPKKSPPKSLDIHTSSPPSEENSQGAKRAVSGKIKNLMGKMGDLKILSPMDTSPLWRRSEEKTDEEDSIADRDSDDGGCISTQGHSSPLSVSEDSTAQKQSQQSTISGESNVESAISFDEPAQVETLSTTASKTRVRIQAKRRPQSRHARKSAIKQSGINFDAVDTSANNLQDKSQTNQSSSAFNKEVSTAVNVSVAHTVTTNSDRLISSTNDNFHRTNDANIFLAADDRSELGSISKESSMSANKNTLLSPSTDEEDLFDVPPDLPEDPQKEDMLFGRAPILSPVERVFPEKPPVTFKPLKDTYIKHTDDVDAGTAKAARKIEKSSVLSESSTTANTKDPISRASQIESKQEGVESKDESKEVIDPLRDNSHDPLKDPSQLFAFVTKTPSPEKGKSLLFSEDDSLFSNGVKKLAEEQIAKKPVLDLFADDVEGDLFSTSLVKPVKKPLKDTKINLFDEDDEDDSLFGPVVKKPSLKSELERKHSVQQPAKKISLFDDDDNDTNLFFEPSEHGQKSDCGSIQEQTNNNEMFTSITEPVRTSHITDIFADQSSEEDDFFATKPVPKKVPVASKSLFSSSSDDDDIFGKKTTTESQVKATETRTTVKKSVTRDLKKTAEKIGEDPLSVLLDD
ncbi:WASH complex subunit FAM21, partial [Habropoda laboriosa]